MSDDWLVGNLTTSPMIPTDRRHRPVNGTAGPHGGSWGGLGLPTRPNEAKRKLLRNARSRTTSP
jgi:hypothetical protein